MSKSKNNNRNTRSLDFESKEFLEAREDQFLNEVATKRMLQSFKTYTHEEIFKK